MESHWNLSAYLLLQHSLSNSDWHATLLKYPPVPSHCIQKKIQTLFLASEALPVVPLPTSWRACLFCPLLPYSLCSSHTSLWRMLKHTKLTPTVGRFHWQFFLPAILGCQVLLPRDIRLNWNDSEKPSPTTWVEKSPFVTLSHGVSFSSQHLSLPGIFFSS